MNWRPLFPLPSPSAVQSDRWGVDGNGRVLYGADLNRIGHEIKWIMNSRLALDGRSLGPVLRVNLEKRYTDLIAGAFLSAHAVTFRGSGPAADDKAAEDLQYHLVRGASSGLSLATSRWLSRLARAPRETGEELSRLTPRRYVLAQLDLVGARHPFEHLGELGKEQAREACPGLFVD